MQFSRLFLIGILIFIGACKNDKPYEEPQTNFSLSSFDWLRGTWSGQIPKDSIWYTETWFTDSTGNWAGNGRMKLGTDTTNEKTGIYKIENRVYYTANVEGQNEGKTIRFQLKDTSNNTFVFADDEHDFPQIIMYKKLTNDSFQAILKGINHGKPRTQTFNFKKQISN